MLAKCRICRPARLWEVLHKEKSRATKACYVGHGDEPRGNLAGCWWYLCFSFWVKVVLQTRAQRGERPTGSDETPLHLAEAQGPLRRSPAKYAWLRQLASVASRQRHPGSATNARYASSLTSRPARRISRLWRERTVEVEIKKELNRLAGRKLKTFGSTRVTIQGGRDDKASDNKSDLGPQKDFTERRVSER